MAKRFPVYIEKVDKNGSKHWVDENCPKCGGTGYIPGYEFIDGARCWKCNATGRYTHRWVERTEEYANVLAEKRNQRYIKKNLAERIAFLEKQGFSPDGKTYVVIGDTFKIKDELKAKGAKFNYMLGWHFGAKQDDYEQIELTMDECFEENNIKALNWRDGLKQFVESKLPKIQTTSQYIGNVGDKIEVKLTQVGRAYFESQFGTSYINMFEDENGNKVIWKTGMQVAEIGKQVTLVGKIKSHSEYKGEKQTNLTRCKIKE